MQVSNRPAVYTIMTREIIYRIQYHYVFKPDTIGGFNEARVWGIARV